MKRCVPLLLLLLTVGCTERALPRPGDVFDLAVPVDLGARDLSIADRRDMHSPCAALDEASCEAVAGCVADLCQGCTCGPRTFQACRALDAAPTPCPDLDCLMPFCCRSSLDCPDQVPICLSPG